MNQLINQLINELINRLINQLINQLINVLINVLIYELINKSIFTLGRFSQGQIIIISFSNMSFLVRFWFLISLLVKNLFFGNWDFK